MPKNCQVVEAGIEFCKAMYKSRGEGKTHGHREHISRRSEMDSILNSVSLYYVLNESARRTFNSEPNN